MARSLALLALAVAPAAAWTPRQRLAEHRPRQRLAERRAPRVFVSAEAVANLEMRTEAAWRTWSPVATQWIAFVALTTSTSAALWAGAGHAVARTYAAAVASGTTWSLAVTHLLPSGGHRVATSMGGTTAGVPSWVAASTRRSASSAGVEAPTVYLIDTEEPNAFAAGRGRNAVVAVTSGLLKTLSARETEAVLAHEIGHLARRDVGRSMQSAAMMSGFSTAARAGRMLLRKRRKKTEKDGEGSGAAAGLALLAAGAASSAVGALLRLAASRDAEYRADATAAAISGPTHLASALAKIDASTAKRDALAAADGAYAHMYFANDDDVANLSSLLSTHPPTARRIAALRDPHGGPTTTPRRAPDWALFAADAVASSPL